MILSQPKNHFITFSNYPFTISNHGNKHINKNLNFCEIRNKINIFSDEYDYPKPIDEIMKNKNKIIELCHCNTTSKFLDNPKLNELLDSFKIIQNEILIIKIDKPKNYHDLFPVLVTSFFFENSKLVIHCMDNTGDFYFFFEKFDSEKFNSFNIELLLEPLESFYCEKNVIDTIKIISILYTEYAKTPQKTLKINAYEKYEIVLKCGEFIPPLINTLALDTILSYVDEKNFCVVADLYGIIFPKRDCRNIFFFKEELKRYNYILSRGNDEFEYSTMAEMLKHKNIKNFKRVNWENSHDLEKQISNNDYLLINGEKEKVIENKNLITISSYNLNYLEKKYGFEDLCKAIIKELQFPYEKIGYEFNLNQLLDNIRFLKVGRFLRSKYQVDNFKLEPKFCKPKRKISRDETFLFGESKYYLFKNSKYDEIYNSIVDYFTEHIRINIRKMKKSCYEIWNDNDDFKTFCIKKIFSQGLDLNKINIREIINSYDDLKISNLLFTTFVIGLVSENGTKIFEPFASLGEIFIGSLALKTERYFGLCEDEEKLCAMSEIWDKIGKRSENHIVLYGEMPDPILPKELQHLLFDICFFTEPRSLKDSQFDSEFDFDFYIFKCLQKCWRMLNCGGVFILKSKNPIKVVAYISQRLEATFLGIVSEYEDGISSLWIWCKGKHRVNFKQINMKNYFSKEYKDSFSDNLDEKY